MSKFKVDSSYGWTTMSPEKMSDHLKKCARAIRSLQKKHNFDTLAFTGSSGSAIAFIMSIHLNIPLLYIRKPHETSHGSQVESNNKKPVRRYLIVDDFICTGETVKNIYNRIESFSRDRRLITPDLVGIFLYGDPRGFDRKRYIEIDRKNIPIYYG